MNLRKVSVKIIYVFLVIVTLILIVIAALFQRIDNSGLGEERYSTNALKLIEGLQIPQYPALHHLKAGWGSANITPKQAAMAGYNPRSEFTSVLDSLYCRVITVSNGSQNISLISLDLLITPPTVKEKIKELMAEKNIHSFPYFSATHTHNGIGNWDKSLAGSFIAGAYRQDIVNKIAEQAIIAIEASINNLQSAEIGYFKIPVPDLVYNRLDAQANKDPYLRGLKITRADSSTGFLVTWSAHPTNLPMKSTYLSADYTGRMVSELETKADFAMFMAGMVGSHALTGIDAKHVEKIRIAGKKLASEILSNKKYSWQNFSSTLQFRHIELPLDKARVRLGGNWQLRNWVFEKGFGRLQASITIVKIGDLVMLSMPGDFSGELYQNHIAGNHGNLEIIITSFNGDFVGYIVDDRHYWTSRKEEVNAMNWLGPGGGEYFAAITNQLLRMLSD